jgi:hypothetical protein
MTAISQRIIKAISGTALIWTGILLFSSFTLSHHAATKIQYAYVSALERAKDSPKDKYFDLYSNIVVVKCNYGHNEVARQFLEHYDSEIKTSKNELVTNTTSAWLYSSYDEALSKRRGDMAKAGREKRTINRFYVTCE